MAFSEDAQLQSFIAGTTFSSTSLYKFVVLDSSGHVVDPNTTGNVLALGTLYSYTNTTSGAGTEAVTVGIGGTVKVKMAASTIAAGGAVGPSTAGFGIAPSSDGYTFGYVKSGSSGAAGRIHSVVVVRGPLNTP